MVAKKQSILLLDRMTKAIMSTVGCDEKTAMAGIVIALAKKNDE